MPPSSSDDCPRTERNDCPSNISFWRLLSDQGILTQAVLHYEYPGLGVESDPYVVNWLEDDLRNPMNFSTRRKVSMTLATAFATLVVSLSSSAYAGSIEQVINALHVSDLVATLGLSLFVLGFSLGPLIWAPLGEHVGRQISFFISFLSLAAFTAGCTGARDITTLLILRFCAGAVGSSPLTNAGGVVSDMFSAKQRGLALCLFAATPYFGPSLGPIIGGFLGMNAGWRWVQILLAISSAVVWVAVSITVPETYAPVLLRKRAKRLSQVTGKCYQSTYDTQRENQPMSKQLQKVLVRPWALLFREPIVLLLSFYAAIIYGTLYMLFAAFPFVYGRTRGWNAGVSGLPFLGVMVGTLLGALYTLYDNKRYIRAQKRAGGFAPPEERLQPCMVSSITIPVGLFWFAWTNFASIHWIVSIIALVPFGFGLILIYLGIVNYLIDSYTIFAASALAAMSILRYLFGAVFPLFTPYMYRALGVHWGSSIPAFLTTLCIPIPFLFYKYGPAIRRNCKYSALSQEHLDRLRSPPTEPSGGSEKEH
ncbi:major facilitator superfamily domain-containing protein [Aspergillus insuetus]